MCLSRGIYNYPKYRGKVIGHLCTFREIGQHFLLKLML